MDDLKQLEIGQIVDFCIDWNNYHDLKQGADDTKKKKTKRKATQKDWDLLLG